jgi:phosphoribosylanthranilate isomerase
MGYAIRVKICGVTSEADAEQAARLGADALGLNFHPPSPRALTLARAEQILRVLPPLLSTVGVFVDRPLDQVRALLGPLGRVTTVQMHGTHQEPLLCPPYQFVPAFAVRAPEDLARIEQYLAEARNLDRLPAAILIDGYRSGLPGGTGQTAPWDLLADFRPAVPLILAGGLTPDNVAEAIRRVRPWAVDVASGVETAPGRKDPEKMRRFLDSARAAAAGL